jgi:hypothetical protein
MAMSMKVSGRMIKLMAREPTCTLMEQCTKEIGRKINSTDTEKRLGLMEHAMRDSMSKERRMERASLSGQMDLHMKASSWTTIFMDMAFTCGLMKGDTKVNG